MSRQSFELLVLGTSSASPTSTRNPSSQLLNIAERYFLIDCGEATQIQLRKYKAKFQAIDHIFISHLHGDHFFGLPGLLSSMHLLGRKQSLCIYCPPELPQLMAHINSVSETTLNFTINWILTDSTPNKLIFEDEKVQVFSFPLKHRIFCTGFLFKEKPLPRKIDKYQLDKYQVSTAYIGLLRAGMDVTNNKGELIPNKHVTLDPELPRTFAYCSDTKYDESIVEIIKNVDLLYHESTFLEEHKERAKKTFHSTASEAALMAKKAGVKQLLIGHFSARYSQLDEFLKQASPHFEETMLAIEGKKIII